MDDLSRRRLDNQRTRHLANANAEVERIIHLVADIRPGQEPGMALGQAEKLAAASVSLLRYISALATLEDVRGLLGAEES
jgi:hypothetical protein